MICFDRGNSRFNFRSVAVIIHHAHILIHQAVGDDFWALPGGRVELLETSDDTIGREMLEELGVRTQVQRQLWQVENFFEYEGRHYHELGHYFLVSLIDPPVIKSEIDFRGIEASIDLVFRWVPLSLIKGYNLQPTFLRDRLVDLPDAIEVLKVNEISG